MTEDKMQRVTGFLGLCTRAGQVSFGQDGCVSAVRGHTAAVVLLDAEGSENTRKRLADACMAHQVKLYVLPEGEIAHAVGKSGVKVVALSRGSMGDKLLSLLDKLPELRQIEPLEGS